MPVSIRQTILALREASGVDKELAKLIREGELVTGDMNYSYHQHLCLREYGVWEFWSKWTDVHHPWNSEDTFTRVEVRPIMRG